LKEGDGVLISEPLARKSRLEVGDRFEIYAQGRTESLDILGVMHDYTSDSGLAVMSFGRMKELFGRAEANSLALYLEEDTDAEKVEDSLNQDLGNLPLRITSNRNLRESILDIFDQTFAVVRILQAVSLLIAVSGITLTLLILARERISELALYRALGAERSQIFRIYLGKGISIATLSAVLGSFGGVALALILIFWINRAYFGWTIRLNFPWVDLSQELALIFLVAVIASVYPAIRASGTPATELNRDDL
jgi:putative ABC transport system permease protein